jgi:hypothetical protein
MWMLNDFYPNKRRHWERLGVEYWEYAGLRDRDRDRDRAGQVVTRVWKWPHRYKIHNLYSSLNITKANKSMRIRWVEHIARMEYMINSQTIWPRNLKMKRTFGDQDVDGIITLEPVFRTCTWLKWFRTRSSWCSCETQQWFHKRRGPRLIKEAYYCIILLFTSSKWSLPFTLYTIFTNISSQCTYLLL